MAKEEKKSFGEKRVSSTQSKLMQLQEKVENNPPKTLLGKKLLQARISRLSNVVDRKILRIEAKNAAQVNQNLAYEDYVNDTESTMHEISDVSLEQENILREIRGLEKLDPKTGSMFESTRQNMQKNMPKGYVPRENKTDRNSARPENKSAVSARIEALMARYDELEQRKEQLNENIATLEDQYKERIQSIKEQKKENLALVAPHPIRDMVNKARGFYQNLKDRFKAAGEKISAWNQARKDKKAEKLNLADEKLQETATDSKEATDKKTFRQEQVVQLSPEYQQQYVQGVQEKFDKIKESQQPDKENSSSEEPEL